MKNILSIIIITFIFTSCHKAGTTTPDSFPATIILKDGSQQPGQIKWFANQNDKLKFRESDNADTKKYSPEDIIGFTTDGLKFYSLFNFEVYTSDYVLLGT